MDVITRRFLVLGRVQGVAFRHHTRLQAEQLGLRGVARNLSDGTVEVIVHGTIAEVEQLAQWLHRGPAMARVAAVQELDAPEDSYREVSAAAAFAVQ